MTTTLLQIKDSTNQVDKVVQCYQNTNNIWFWIAVVELIIILLLLAGKFKSRKELGFDEKVINESKSVDVDMDNVVNSIYQSKGLYDKLKVKCHPDRFPDHELNTKADKLYQEITKNKRNYKMLLELRDIAEAELKIKI